MIYTIIVSTTSIILAYLARYNRFRYGLELSFIILTFYLGIRYDYGYDYMSYLEIFEDIKIGVDSNYSVYQSIKANQFSCEFGWIILNHFFANLGFHWLVLLLTILEHWVLYRCIKIYVSPHWYWLAVFIYSINPDNMLTDLSMMRQYLSMTIFLLSIKDIINGNIGIYLLKIIVAIMFHSSAAILIPVYIVRYIPIFKFNKTKMFFTVFILLFGWYMFVDRILGGVLNSIMNINLFTRYLIYADFQQSDAISLGFSTIIYCAIFSSGLVVAFNSPQNKIIILVSLIGILIIPFGKVIPLITRLSFYFTYILIIALPIIISMFTKKIYRAVIVLLFFIFSVKSFIAFHSSSLSSIYYTEYTTILTSPLLQ